MTIDSGAEHLSTTRARSGPGENRIALAAIRSIIEAAAPLTLSVEGTSIAVEVAPLPPARWPASGVAGLDLATDGPWPPAVRLDCRWEGGRATLVLSVAFGRGNGPARSLVGLQIAAAEGDRPIVWVTLPLAPREGQGGERVWVGASFSLRKGRTASPGDAADARVRAATLRGAVSRSGLPLASPWYVEAFSVRLPEGEVLPLPGDAFRRLVHLALVKLPFFVATLPRAQVAGVIEGRPPFDIDALPQQIEPAEAVDGARLARLYPLPGGVRRYKATLDALLIWIAAVLPTRVAFRERLKEQYDAPSPAAADAYLRLLEALGFVEKEDEAIALSGLGQDYLGNPDPVRLFERLHAVYLGMLEALVIADVDGAAGTARTLRLLEGLLERRYKTPNQISFRKNWLLSLGFTERTEAGEAVTALGRKVIIAHAAEVDELRRRIADLLEEQFEEELAAVESLAQDAEAAEDEEEITALGEAPRPGEAGMAPAGWWADRVDLTAAMVRPHLGGLEMGEPLLERICAALSSGKHLLLVGPPGTGKTEIAMALGAAAKTEGYSEGIFAATASADWTTFDTIGGYTLHKDSALRFRPGVFLSAIERWQWLLIDELNRADIDRSFGELMTVLAGRGAVTPFTLEDGRLISIGPEAHTTHRVPRAFRLIATMNTWDKSSLFKLSFAVQRRFAIVHIGAPADAGYARLIAEGAARGGIDPPLDLRARDALLRLFRAEGLFAYRPIGPAVALDMIRFMQRRGVPGDALAEAMVMYLLPQLEGLEPEAALAVFALLDGEVAGFASTSSREELRVYYQLLFPLIDLPTD